MLSTSVLHDRLGFGAPSGGNPVPRHALAGFAMRRLGCAHAPSLLLSGHGEAILVNAQFLHSDAVQVAQAVQASGRRLSAIYISSAEPQAYFGLGVLQAAFPHARILASGETVETIRRQAGATVAHWGGILKHNAPRSIILPQIHEGASLPLEGASVCLQSLLAALG